MRIGILEKATFERNPEKNNYPSEEEGKGIQKMEFTSPGQ